MLPAKTICFSIPVARIALTRDCAASRSIAARDNANLSIQVLSGTNPWAACGKGGLPRFSSQGSTRTKAGLTARLITIWPRLANAWEASSLVKLMARLLPNQYVANSGGTMRVSTGAGFSLSLQIHSSGFILEFLWYPTQFTVVMRSIHRLWYHLFQFPCYILVVQLGGAPEIHIQVISSYEQSCIWRYPKWEYPQIIQVMRPWLSIETITVTLGLTIFRNPILSIANGVINQLINQYIYIILSIHQSINQPIYQSVNQSIYIYLSPIFQCISL